MKTVILARHTKIALQTTAFLLALLSTTALPILVNPPSALAGSNTYPTSIAGCRYVSTGGTAGTCDLKDSAQDYYYDPWGEENRECTSYAAWMLSSANGFTMPFYADAVNWGPKAQGLGYTVNTTPAVGSIYWSSGADHVAWVESISSDGNAVTLEDYNSGWPSNPGLWNEYTTSTSSASGYIHFKDLTATAFPDRSDVDGNQGADLILTTNQPEGGSAASALLSTYGSFLAPAQWWHDTGVGWSGITPLVADVTGDGKADYIFIANNGAAGVVVYVAASTGSTFLAPSSWWSGSYGYGGIKASVGDVTGDGKADLILTTNEPTGGSAAQVLASTGSSFGSPAVWWHDSGTGWTGITPFVGDVNGDKKDDYVFLANSGTGTNAYVATSTGSIFGIPQLWWQSSWGYGGIKANLGDMDGNGGADLVLTTNQPEGGSAMSVLLSTYGSFLAPTQWWHDTGVGWTGITPFVADFNNYQINGHLASDYLFLANNNNAGTNAYVAMNTNGTAAGLQGPALWWQSSWGYSGMKAAAN